MSPAALRAQAARLRVAGASLPQALRHVAAATGADVWRGPAARAFEEELVRRERHLARCGDELLALSRRLMVLADDLEERARHPSAGGVGQTANG